MSKSKSRKKLTVRDIRHLKIDLDLSDEEIARLVNERFNVHLSGRYVRMILRGERPGYKHRAKIAKVIGVEVDRLPEPQKWRAYEPKSDVA